MYIIVTRTFPPELGGMQSLMWGLSREMSKNFMIKVFTDYHKDHKEYEPISVDELMLEILESNSFAIDLAVFDCSTFNI